MVGGIGDSELGGGIFVRFSLIGYGTSTKEIAKFILKHGLGEIFVSEKRKLTEEEKSYLKENKMEFEEDGNTFKATTADVVVYSPSVRPDCEILQLARRNGAKTMGELEFAWRYLLSPSQAKVVAVTGSNGKTTTVSLLDHLMNTAGIAHFTGGNIGIASAKYAGEPIALLEVSSFQLMGVEEFHADIGAILNISPNHLDWHKDMKEYISAKMKLSNADTFVYNADSEHMPACDGISVSKDFGDVFVDVENLEFWVDAVQYTLASSQLRGVHNLYNAAFSVMVALLLGVSPEDAQKALETFTPLVHRQEAFAVVNGVKYVNDSKSTTSASTMVALENFDSVVLILGGRPKENDYTELIKSVKEKAKFVILMGEMVSVLKNSFADFPHAEVRSLEEAVEVAQEVSKSGDTVLLSPAATSYDMFKNYAERGTAFKRLVYAKRDV